MINIGGFTEKCQQRTKRKKKNCIKKLKHRRKGKKHQKINEKQTVCANSVFWKNTGTKLTKKDGRGTLPGKKAVSARVAEKS